MLQGEACRRAGNTASLPGWAALAARHGVVSLDSFDAGSWGPGSDRTSSEEGRDNSSAAGGRRGSSDSSGSGRRGSGDSVTSSRSGRSDSLSSLNRTGSGGSDSSDSAGSGRGGRSGSLSSLGRSGNGNSGTGAAPAPAPPSAPLRLPSQRRMGRKLSAVVEDSEDAEEEVEEEEGSGGERRQRSIRSVLSLRAQVQQFAAVLQAEGGLEGVDEGDDAGEAEEEVEGTAAVDAAEGEWGDCSPGAAATADGDGAPASALTACELLAATAAAGLVPRPGAGCHLTGGGHALQLLHLDTVPFAIRYGEPGKGGPGAGPHACLLAGRSAPLA